MPKLRGNTTRARWVCLLIAKASAWGRLNRRLESLNGLRYYGNEPDCRRIEVLTRVTLR